jgi:hypothetical protein
MDLFLWMIRVRNACIYRTDRSTLRLIKVTFTLYAFVKVDDVNRITSCYCLNRAFGFAQPTGSAFIINFVCHVASLITPRIIAIYVDVSREYHADESAGYLSKDFNTVCSELRERVANPPRASIG